MGLLGAEKLRDEEIGVASQIWEKQDGQYREKETKSRRTNIDSKVWVNFSYKNGLRTSLS